ncbi:MAG: hypothetical protein LBL50_01420 [Candidatus Margulisbacteria bacterium]|jgi:hypothetical protein|nr:hypothetical protein [Candidatus Margulisiibacteriota bacterium]
MLCRKIISAEIIADWQRDLKTNYRDKMAFKYYFSSQAIGWSRLYILRDNANLAIRFKESENVSVQVGKKEFSEVTNMYFCNDEVSYLITKDGNMYHFYNGELCDITAMIANP